MTNLIDEDKNALAAARFPQRHYNKEPGDPHTTFIGMEAEEGRSNTRSMIQGWIDAEAAKQEREIAVCKQNGRWNWKTGGAIINGHWEGDKKTGFVVSDLPKKTYSIEELTAKVDELTATIAALKSPVVEKNKPSNPTRNKRSK